MKRARLLLSGPVASTCLLATGLLVCCGAAGQVVAADGSAAGATSGQQQEASRSLTIELSLTDLRLLNEGTRSGTEETLVSPRLEDAPCALLEPPTDCLPRADLNLQPRTTGQTSASAAQAGNLHRLRRDIRGSQGGDDAGALIEESLERMAQPAPAQ